MSTILLKPNVDILRPIGRTCLDSEQNRWFGLSGSGVEFCVSKGCFAITLLADSMFASKTHRARFALYINDDLFLDSLLDKSELRIEYNGFDTPYTVKLIKISECAQSTVGIKSIEISEDASVYPVFSNSKLIEFVGDSITCGYGVDMEDPNTPFMTSTEDFRKSYAYLTSEALKCQYSMVSYSGYGIVSGYTETDIPHPDVLPPIYDKVGWSMGSYFDFSLNNEECHFVYQPDLIIINLGTNDATYIKDFSDRRQLFVEKYIDFLTLVRDKNPLAPIVCCLGIMGDSLFPQIEEAINRFVLSTGDKEIYCFKFDVQSPGDGYSTGFHPTYSTYRKASSKLVEYLSNNFIF